MLTLYEHPFALYCQKVLVALNEQGIAPEVLEEQRDFDRAELAELWPPASIPVLPFALFGFMLNAKPDYVEVLWTTDLGKKMSVAEDLSNELKAVSLRKDDGTATWSRRRRRPTPRPPTRSTSRKTRRAR